MMSDKHRGMQGKVNERSFTNRPPLIPPTPIAMPDMPDIPLPEMPPMPDFQKQADLQNADIPTANDIQDGNNDERDARIAALEEQVARLSERLDRGIEAASQDNDTINLDGFDDPHRIPLPLIDRQQNDQAPYAFQVVRADEGDAGAGVKVRGGTWKRYADGVLKSGSVNSGDLYTLTSAFTPSLPAGTKYIVMKLTDASSGPDHALDPDTLTVTQETSEPSATAQAEGTAKVLAHFEVIDDSGAKIDGPIIQDWTGGNITDIVYREWDHAFHCTRKTSTTIDISAARVWLAETIDTTVSETNETIGNYWYIVTIDYSSGGGPVVSSGWFASLAAAASTKTLVFPILYFSDTSDATTCVEIQKSDIHAPEFWDVELPNGTVENDLLFWDYSESEWAVFEGKDSGDWVLCILDGVLTWVQSSNDQYDVFQVMSGPTLGFDEARFS